MPWRICDEIFLEAWSVTPAETRAIIPEHLTVPQSGLVGLLDRMDTKCLALGTGEPLFQKLFSAA